MKRLIIFIIGFLLIATISVARLDMGTDLDINASPPTSSSQVAITFGATSLTFGATALYF